MSDKEWQKNVESIVYPGRIKVPYNWSVGETGSRFLAGINNEKRLQGTKCPQCNRVYVPPRNRCPECFKALKEWITVGPQGSIVTYTIVRYSESIHPYEPPFAYAVIQLDGSDTGLTHIVTGSEADLAKLAIGSRVEAVFTDEPKMNILDLKYFKLVPSGSGGG